MKKRFPSVLTLFIIGVITFLIVFAYLTHERNKYVESYFSDYECREVEVRIAPTRGRGGYSYMNNRHPDGYGYYHIGYGYGCLLEVHFYFKPFQTSPEITKVRDHRIG